MTIPFLELIKGEFDSERKILHLTAREKLVVETRAELNELCAAVTTVIKHHSKGERIYMIVDLAKFVIEPYLNEDYAKKIKSIYENYLLTNGLLRYGLGITRVTIKLGHAGYLDSDPNLFKTKKEAFAHVDKLITQMTTPVRI
ncbi:MAG: hypothetical protein AB1746_14235 [Candidatus Zixiibacteriota bacterium]